MPASYRSYTHDQPLLLPPDLRDWLPEDHLARFIVEVVAELDLHAFYPDTPTTERRGGAAIDPRLLVSLIVYRYCQGQVSSRSLERATYEDLPCRFIAADQHPDHTTIALFRQHHLDALADLFTQVLQLCREAGLVRLGHIAIDGTKMKANASKHKAMSYDRMGTTEDRLVEEMAALLAQAAAVDAAEDAQAAAGALEVDLPAELARRAGRVARIRAAKAALEAAARAAAEQQAADAQEQIAARERQAAETEQKPRGRAPHVPDPDAAVPDPKAQRNFTDPESRIMPDHGLFIQGFNAQAAVDGDSQIIVACEVVQAPNDVQQLVPLLLQVFANCGEWPSWVSADTGYFSLANLTDPRIAACDLYIPPERQRHGAATTATAPPKAGSTPPTPEAALREAMRAKLRTLAGKMVYAMRKAIVEPVFGQITDVRGLAQFLMRGLARVRAEWRLICLTHNLLKLHRARRATREMPKRWGRRVGGHPLDGRRHPVLAWSMTCSRVWWATTTMAVLPPRIFSSTGS